METADETGRAREAADNPCRCSGWRAWYDRMPGPDYDVRATLHVAGECTCPGGGYEVRLEPARFGINPRIRMLRLIMTPPPTGAGVMTPVSVDYTEETAVGAYDQVTILPGGETLDIDEAS